VSIVKMSNVFGSNNATVKGGGGGSAVLAVGAAAAMVMFAVTVAALIGGAIALVLIVLGSTAAGCMILTTVVRRSLEVAHWRKYGELPIRPQAKYMIERFRPADHPPIRAAPQQSTWPTEPPQLEAPRPAAPWADQPTTYYDRKLLP
jgi:hypothetical protein